MLPHHYFWLSTFAAFLTIGLKTLAWWLTGSMGLLSDALESFVNLAGATFALWMITIARLPPDEDHPLGHGKAEYFSSGFEGILIFGAAGSIIYTASLRLFSPQPLESVGIGLAFSVASTLVNLAVARAMHGASQRYRSIALEADARHLMTDVWTSVGVVAGVLLVGVTGWLRLDPVVAILVGLHILREGWRLINVSAHGLMDSAVPAETLAAVEAALASFTPRNVGFDNLRTRRAGSESFVYVNVKVPRDWSIVQVHDLLDEIELAVRQRVPGAQIITHPEPQPL
jgi:cation diffusion facilitator family transporter